MPGKRDQGLMRQLSNLLYSGLIFCLLTVGISGCQTGRQAMLSQQKEAQYKVPSMQLASGLEEPREARAIKTAEAFEEAEGVTSGPEKWSEVLNRFKFTPFKPIPPTVTVPADQVEVSQNTQMRQAF